MRTIARKFFLCFYLLCSATISQSKAADSSQLLITPVGPPRIKLSTEDIDSKWLSPISIGAEKGGTGLTAGRDSSVGAIDGSVLDWRTFRGNFTLTRPKSTVWVPPSMQMGNIPISTASGIKSNDWIRTDVLNHEMIGKIQKLNTLKEEGTRQQKQLSLENQILRDYYRIAIEQGVIDRSILQKYPLTDGDEVHPEFIEKYKKFFPISRVNPLLGKPGVGVGCLICIPSPGFPEAGPIGPGPGYPDGAPIILSPSTTYSIPPSSKEILLQGRIDEKFNPVGFLEVVRVQVENGTKVKDCTGTLVSSTTILTAAHCVPETKNDLAKLKVWIPKQEPPLIEKCNEAIRLSGKYVVSCVAFQLGNVTSYERHEHYQKQSNEYPAVNDIAVIRLETKDSLASIGNPTRVRIAVDLPESITVAGYGQSSVPDRNKELIEVGWNSGILWNAEGKDFKYDPAISGQSGACVGDSGEPVFVGKVYGYDPRQQLTLVAIISAGKTGGGQCSSPYWISTTRLSAAPVRAWLCKQNPIFLMPYCSNNVAEVGH